MVLPLPVCPTCWGRWVQGEAGGGEKGGWNELLQCIGG